jgi:hypothetical protein
MPYALDNCRVTRSDVVPADVSAADLAGAHASRVATETHRVVPVDAHDHRVTESATVKITQPVLLTPKAQRTTLESPPPKGDNRHAFATCRGKLNGFGRMYLVRR